MNKQETADTLPPQPEVLDLVKVEDAQKHGRAQMYWGVTLGSFVGVSAFSKGPTTLGRLAKDIALGGVFGGSFMLVDKALDAVFKRAPDHVKGEHMTAVLNHADPAKNWGDRVTAEEVHQKVER